MDYGAVGSTDVLTLYCHTLHAHSTVSYHNEPSRCFTGPATNAQIVMACLVFPANDNPRRVNALGEPLPTKESSLKGSARPRPDLYKKDDQQAALPDRKIVVEPLEWFVLKLHVGLQMRTPLILCCRGNCVECSEHFMSPGDGYCVFQPPANLSTARCQMSDYRSTEASTLMLKSLRKDFMTHGLFLVRTEEGCVLRDVHPKIIMRLQRNMSAEDRTDRGDLVEFHEWKM